MFDFVGQTKESSSSFTISKSFYMKYEHEKIQVKY